MSTVPDPFTWVNGEIPNFRDMQDRVADILNWVTAPPMIRLRKVGNQTITNATSTAIAWDFVETETENMWDATVPNKITPKTAGWYIGTYGGSFQVNGTGYRQIDARKNGDVNNITMRTKFDGLSAGSTVGRGISFLEQFNGTTDYLEIMLFQNSGASRNIDATSLETEPDVVLRWFAPL